MLRRGSDWFRLRVKFGFVCASAKPLRRVRFEAQAEPIRRAGLVSLAPRIRRVELVSLSDWFRLRVKFGFVCASAKPLRRVGFEAQAEPILRVGLVSLAPSCRCSGWFSVFGLRALGFGLDTELRKKWMEQWGVIYPIIGPWSFSGMRGAFD